MYKETFGKKLRQARVEAGYTQQQIEDITQIKKKQTFKIRKWRKRTRY